MPLFGWFFILLLSCLIIWRASNGFEIAADYLGRKLSNGVKGATINAIGSSMPELFTTLFFLFVLGDREGFSGGLGTTAGSAIFNILLIPACVLFAVFFFSAKRKRISVKKGLVWRDGLFLLGAELLLFFFMEDNSLSWFHGLLFLAFYGVYLFVLLRKNNCSKLTVPVDNHFIKPTTYPLWKKFCRLNIEALFIKGDKLSPQRAWLLLLTSTFFIGLACYYLVESCEAIGNILHIHFYFVSLILAAAATSLPDTILSVKDARKGNYADAISNALGSNIFDICFVLGFTLLLFCLWQGDIIIGEAVSNDLLELRVLLIFLTIFSLLVFVTGSALNIFKAYLLLGAYLLFIIFIICLVQDVSWAVKVSQWLQVLGTAFK